MLIVISGIFGLYAAIHQSTYAAIHQWLAMGMTYIYVCIVINVFIYIHFSMVTALWFIVIQELYNPK